VLVWCFLDIFRHMKMVICSWGCLIILCFQSVFGQKKEAGPVIKDFGKVWKVQNADYPTKTAQEFKVVFDVMNSPDNPSQRNASIETAARFLNMHAQSGVPIAQLHVALVVHNKASKDLITNEAYQNRFGIDNPNAEMIAQLLDADVDILFCGQSSMSRNFPKNELIPGVQLALSAMTALIQLQNEGYTFIKF